MCTLVQNVSLCLGITSELIKLVSGMLDHGTLEANKCLAGGTIELDFCVSVLLAVEGWWGDILLQFLINLPFSCLLQFEDFVIQC